MTIGTILAFIVATLAVTGCIILVCGSIAGLVTTIREPRRKERRYV